MRVRWSGTAADDLARIVEYVREDNVLAARRIASEIFQLIVDLASMPGRGRVGRAEGTRELLLTRLPYIVVYEIIHDRIQILRIRHSAQNWP
jgi:addiction module RelE/StbE family toxin